MADQLNVDAFLEQARSYDKASSSPVGWYIRFVTTCVVHSSWVAVNSYLEALDFFFLVSFPLVNQECSNKATFTSSACSTRS